MATIALDIGGTKISAARVEQGRCVERRQTPMRFDEAGFITALREVTAFGVTPGMIAVAATGFVRAGRVYSVNLDTIPFWRGFPLEAALRQLYSCPVVLMNDAQAAAWGEYSVRQGRVRNLLFMTLSTGVGGGLVLDGELRTGGHGLAGHLGHATVSRPPADVMPGRWGPCGCGRYGCLESVASGTALARQAGALFGRAIDSRALFALAATSARANDIIDNAAAAVAEAIANTHMLLDIDEVVIGGSVGLAAGMLDRIRQAQDALPPLGRVAVSGAALGADAGLMGAAGWARRGAG
ncbi:ROK family protein [Sodalis sp. C49]|uniref:ROK family protein n=1 Tax=unclassified Sodalis (in: enterobacteria) TaxID=2636512 RepID=UPI003965AC05